MGQATHCQTDVESIMRRLRGKETPYTPPQTVHLPTIIPHHGHSAELEELKQVIKTLGAKLKESYDDIAEKKTAIGSISQTNQRLSLSLEQLQATFLQKEQDLASARETERVAKLSLEQVEKNLADIRSKNDALSPDFAALQEELLAIRTEQLSWQEERKRLEIQLDQERHRKRSETSSANGQLVRLAMSCKQLEEEIHSLKCERAATARQSTQLKELSEEAQKALIAEKEKMLAIEHSLAANESTLKELLNTIEEQKSTIRVLSEEKEEASLKEARLIGKIGELNITVAKEKTALEDTSIFLKGVEESRATLHIQLEQEKRTVHEAQEKALLLQREKEASDIRVKEVEELLITKLQTISDLEEQLGEAVANGEDLEHRALSSEQNAENLTLELQKLSEARDELHEKTVTLEQRLSRTTTENAELKKRTESFDRLKKSISEASSHAHAILRTLDHGPKPSRSSFQPIDDQLIAPEQERSLFEEHFEQHELF